MKHCIVLGTRPQIIKMSPLILELEKRRANYFVIDTGQHSLPAMQAAIYSDLGLPFSKYMLEDYDKDSSAETVRDILSLECPDTVHVHGDTDSTVIGAMAAASLGIPVAHHEAGLRAGTLWMKEEQNRILTDHTSRYLFAPTETARLNLYREKCLQTIHVTGNLIADVLDKHAGAIQPIKCKYILLTLHRQETVDQPEMLRLALDGVSAAARVLNLPVIYPAHPRTQNKLLASGIPVPGNIQWTDPLSFMSFLADEKSASLIMTDSGGVQEEACILGVPCVTLRESTERPETVDIGANAVIGDLCEESIVHAAQEMFNRKATWAHPYGSNVAAKTFDLIQ